MKHAAMDAVAVAAMLALVPMTACGPTPTAPAPTAGTTSTVASPTIQRFVFPAQATPFPGASVALDTTTGRLCKTYPWPDNRSLPSGLALCTGATNASGGPVESVAEWKAEQEQKRGSGFAAWKAEQEKKKGAQ
jgi:hypothetical protein